LSAGGGMVTAVVNGKFELVRVRIEPSLLQNNPDVEMVQDLVVAAVNEAVRAARRMIEEERGKLTGGAGAQHPPIGAEHAPRAGRRRTCGASRGGRRRT